MNGKRFLAAVVLCCFSILGMSACRSQQAGGSDKIYVGVASYNQSDTFISELVGCFEEQLNRLESEKRRTVVTIRDAAGQQRKQNDQVKEMLDAGCNVLCVNLVDRSDPSEIIDLAREHDCLLYFLTESLWRKICCNGTGFIMWGRMRKSPVSCKGNWRRI